jgi:hypothetical protein
MLLSHEIGKLKPKHAALRRQPTADVEVKRFARPTTCTRRTDRHQHERNVVGEI